MVDATIPNATGYASYYGAWLRMCWITDDSRFTIAKYCAIGDHLTVYLGGEHRMDVVSIQAPAKHKWKHYSKGNVTVCNNVWIGDNVTIMSGVTIGNGAIVGACSVVTKDVRPYAVVAGNPAREKRRRFSDETVEALLAIKWWDWPPEKVKRNKLFGNVEQFVAKYGSKK